MKFNPRLHNFRLIYFFQKFLCSNYYINTSYFTKFPHGWISPTVYYALKKAVLFEKLWKKPLWNNFGWKKPVDGPLMIWNFEHACSSTQWSISLTFIFVQFEKLPKFVFNYISSSNSNSTFFKKFSNSPVCKWQQSVVFPHDSSSKCTCKATQKALFCGFCRKKNDEKNHEGLRMSRCYHSGGEFKSKDFLTKSLNGKKP